MGPKSSINEGKQVQKYDHPKSNACSKCGKFHRGECRFGSNLCFYCKKEGHYIHECPEKKRNEAGHTAPTHGRVYMLDAQKAKALDNLLIGTGSLFYKPISIL